jgi:hypothetical protein
VDGIEIGRGDNRLHVKMNRLSQSHVEWLTFILLALLNRVVS